MFKQLYHVPAMVNRKQNTGFDSIEIFAKLTGLPVFSTAQICSLHIRMDLKMLSHCTEHDVKGFQILKADWTVFEERD